ncbi:hypothetical protein TcCL_Unassigned05499, partial [Trypanosoma cruzi]
GCSQIVIFTGTPPSCSGAVLHVEVPESNSEPGSLVARRRSANGLGLGSALCGGGAIGVPSLALVLAQVAGGGSGGIPGGSGTPGEIDFPQRLGACNATDVGHVRHDTHAATAVLAAHRAVCRASDRGGVGPAGGGGVSVRGSLRACCAASELHQQHVLGMTDCSGRSSHP